MAPGGEEEGDVLPVFLNPFFFFAVIVLAWSVWRPGRWLVSGGRLSLRGRGGGARTAWRGARPTAALALAIVLAGSLPAGAQPARPQPRFAERVEVTRIVIDVRVLDGTGRPVLGLGADDFEVEIGGTDVRVESAEWVGALSPGAAGTRPAGGPAPEGEPRGPDARNPRDADEPGRLIVLLFQKDMEPQRIRGLMRLLLDLRGYVGTLTPRDRVAVLSFDTRLLVWLDFTNDLDAVRGALERDILFSGPGPTQAATGISLMGRLPQSTARQTFTIERALRLIGEALEPLPGGKTLVLVGHGFGTLTRLGMTIDPDYDEASEILQRARVTVVSLDVTQVADEHSLELGLRLVAEDTGGFYEATQLFTGRPLARLDGVLAGHYVLIADGPELADGEHAIRVRLRERAGRVMARKTFVR